MKKNIGQPAHIYLLALVIFNVYCSPNNKIFGTFKKVKAKDSINTQQRVLSIKSINNNIFDSLIFTKENTTVKYRLLKPINTNTQKLPLVIVFHGSGAIGNDNLKQLGALAKFWALPNIQNKYPAFILAPQFATRSANYFFDSNRHVLASLPEPCLNTTLQLIDSLKAVLPIDENKVYLVGFSMGASTAINALTLRPNLFAACISIAGIARFDMVNELSNIPIWMIHGNADIENPINSDLQFVTEIKSRKKNKLLFWEFNNTGHNEVVFEMLIGNKLAHWLFNNKK